jgi:hypothetical protein
MCRNTLLTWIGLFGPIKPSSRTGQTVIPHRSDQSGAGLVLARTITPSPGLQLDVPHMHFDCLDETYAMVKSNWHFEHNGLTGLTSVGERLDWWSRLLNQLYDQLPSQTSWPLIWPWLFDLHAHLVPLSKSFILVHLNLWFGNIFVLLQILLCPFLWNHIQNIQDDPLVL